MTATPTRQGPRDPRAATRLVLVSPDRALDPIHRRNVVARWEHARRTNRDVALVIGPLGGADPAALSWLEPLAADRFVHASDAAAVAAAGIDVSGLLHRDGDGTLYVVAGDADAIALPPRPRRPRPRRRYRLSHVAIAATLACACLGTAVAAIAPSPFEQSVPGPLYRAGPSSAHESGRLEFATTRSHRLRWIEVPVSRFRSLWQPVEVARLADVPPDAFLDAAAEPSNERSILGSQVAHAVAGLVDRRHVATGDGVLVEGVAHEDGLGNGDVIVDVDGRRVRSVTALFLAFEQYRPGTYLKVVLRGGGRGTVWLKPDPTVARGYLPSPPASNGQFVEPYSFRTHGLPPAPASVRPHMGTDDTHGRSRGLAMALDAWQRTTGTDLVRGRHIVATGIVNDAGMVDMVSGVSLKVEAAAAAGADIVLVPELLVPYAEVHGPYSPRMRIVGVADLRDAVRALSMPDPYMAASRAGT